ncbi:hypothetical protein GCM10023231_30440 [Olivibacter ginsenosidimutans]|uniref:HD/PDEase domain-containing protein n=1 Tax=Olivibacter ginsenosidimutans TaxID=1176537 RepID=A0ABP9BRS3_9SPHI
MNYQAIITETAEWVNEYVAQHSTTSLCFHNLTHTLQVVEAAKKIGSYYQLAEHDLFIVTEAAYFHDLGYYNGAALGHEVRSAEIAATFLRERSVEEDTILAIQNCIKATHIPQQPKNLLEEIVCDADLFHLGGDDFLDRNKLMHKEAETCKAHSISKSDWRKGTIQLLQNHHYHTSYAKLFLEEKKKRNLKMLLKKEGKDGEEAKEKTKEKKKNRPDRGIETMFRVTSTNNQRLSDMADNKSHILITVNSIILSAIFALLMRKLDSNEHLIVPTLILLAVSLSTMTIAILATRPNIPKGYFTGEDLSEKKVNLLFFGNFYKMDLKAYNQGMRAVMEDRDFLYGTLIMDVYSQGVVLGRKYRLLRWAYNIFMFGLIAAVLAFSAAAVGYL